MYFHMCLCKFSYFTGSIIPRVFPVLNEMGYFTNHNVNNYKILHESILYFKQLDNKWSCQFTLLPRILTVIPAISMCRSQTTTARPTAERLRPDGHFSGVSFVHESGYWLSISLPSLQPNHCEHVNSETLIPLTSSEERNILDRIDFLSPPIWKQQRNVLDIPRSLFMLQCFPASKHIWKSAA